jgi:hypothetical protein
MVDGQVRPSDVTDHRIIGAMLALPRELFVPEDRRALAYLDLDLDVSEKGAPKRFLIKPMVVAKMVQAADIKSTDNVLVVGCATGYTAALVAKLAGRVTATEGDKALAAKAAGILATLGLGQVSVVNAAASEGAPASAPYDARHGRCSLRIRTPISATGLSSMRLLRFCPVSNGPRPLFSSGMVRDERGGSTIRCVVPPFSWPTKVIRLPGSFYACGGLNPCFRPPPGLPSV